MYRSARFSLMFVAVSLLLLISYSTAHADSTIRATVGSRTLILPAPKGLHNPGAIAPSIDQWVSAFIPSGTRLLTYFIQPAITKAVVRGEAPNFERYATVQIMHKLEASPFDLNDISGMKTTMRANAGDTFTVGADASGQIDAFMESISGGSATMKVGETRGLGVFDESLDSISMLVAMLVEVRVGNETVHQPMVGSTTFVRLQDRLVFFYLFSQYSSREDEAWVKAQTREWVREALKVN